MPSIKVLSADEPSEANAYMEYKETPNMATDPVKEAAEV